MCVPVLAARVKQFYSFMQHCSPATVAANETVQEVTCVYFSHQVQKEKKEFSASKTAVFVV